MTRRTMSDVSGRRESLSCSTVAIEFARELIVAYGLVGWRADLNRAVRRFGACHHPLPQAQAFLISQRGCIAKTMLPANRTDSPIFETRRCLQYV